MASVKKRRAKSAIADVMGNLVPAASDGAKMTWNYRVIQRVEPTTYAIHEVYYDNGIPKLVTENAVAPMGESPEELRRDCQHYILALDKPILDYDKDFPG